MSGYSIQEGDVFYAHESVLYDYMLEFQPEEFMLRILISRKCYITFTWRSFLISSERDLWLMKELQTKKLKW